MHIFPIGTFNFGILVTGKTWRVLAFSPTHSLGLGSTRTLLTSPWTKSPGQVEGCPQMGSSQRHLHLAKSLEERKVYLRSLPVLLLIRVYWGGRKEEGGPLYWWNKVTDRLSTIHCVWSHCLLSSYPE